MTKKIKLVIWDLDNTLWHGILLEDKQLQLRDEAIHAIKTLDARGILHSIASKNDEKLALQKLNEFGLSEYFLYPQINWGAKSESVKQIVKDINIGIDTVAFVDDSPFEREEVQYNHPQVLCLDANDLSPITTMPEFIPKFITEDSKNRRRMYLGDYQRKIAEQEACLPKQEFLATLGMEMEIYLAEEKDLQRAEELTVRTHQLNTTGYTYSYEELKNFISSPKHKLIMVSLKDKFGDYGKIGLALLETCNNIWTIKLLLMSCRVMDRGVGSALILQIIANARKAGAKLQAEFVKTAVNRMMYVTYKMLGFQEIHSKDDYTLLEHNSQQNLTSSFTNYLIINNNLS